MSDEFDFVIVGAGSAGCVLALRLAEAGCSVCLLEAGPSDRNPLVQIPAGYVKNIFNPRLTWSFATEPVAGLGGRSVKLPQGRTLGGSSAINGMIYNRGQPEDYDSWAQAGNTGWSHDDVLPYFRKSERRIGEGDPRYHGREGRLTVSDLDFPDPLCDRFVAAAAELSYPRVQDYNAARQEGVGPWQFTIDPRGWRPVRMSAARAFLRPALRTGRVDLRTGSPALRVLLDQGRATGVRYRAGGPGAPVREVRARREVILSAGAINTPRLLQVSGIGPAEHLRRIGVEVMLDLPGVGQNFADHYQLRVAVRVKGIGTLNERGRGLPLAREVLNWTLGRPSILGIGPVLMRLFCRSDPALERPDLQLSFTPASYQEGLPGLLDHYPGITLGGYQQRPESLGHVLARSADIDTPPEIQPNYLATENDRRAMVDVIRIARQLLGSAAFAEHYVEEVFPGPAVADEAQILDFARQHGGTAYHPVGTAKMGPEGDPMAVVDPQLRLRGLAGLRVVDASVMPRIVSGNTNAPTLMIAEKAADMLLR